MTRTRKRRIAIAALVVAVLAVVLAFCRPANSDAFYSFLEQHPTMHRIARRVFVMAGKEGEFDAGIFEAIYRRLIKDVDPKLLNE